MRVRSGHRVGKASHECPSLQGPSAAPPLWIVSISRLPSAAPPAPLARRGPQPPSLPGPTAASPPHLPPPLACRPPAPIPVRPSAVPARDERYASREALESLAVTSECPTGPRPSLLPTHERASPPLFSPPLFVCNGRARLGASAPDTGALASLLRIQEPWRLCSGYRSVCDEQSHPPQLTQAAIEAKKL